MFVIGSIFLAASSSDSYFPGNLNFPQDWICSWHTKSCYWVTDDLNRLNGGGIVSSADCRYNQPEVTLITSMFVNTYISSLCGCQYCSFTIPTAAPTPSPAPEPPSMGAPELKHQTLAPTIEEGSWMTFDQEELFRNKDPANHMEMMNFWHNIMGFSITGMEFLKGGGNYTVFFCIKSVETPYSTTCEPVIICRPSPACGNKDTSTEEVPVTNKSKASELKGLWGLLFLPGFCVGICAAYGVYRQRVKNRKKESKQGHFIEPIYDNQVSVPQNQLVQQGVKHDVADPRETNGGDSRLDESIAVMN